MKFIHADQVNSESIAPGVYRKIMGYESDLMVVKVVFESGTSFPNHQHEHQQITYIFKGVFKVEIDGETDILKAGDSYVVPGNALHGVACIEAGELIDTFSPMRNDFL